MMNRENFFIGSRDFNSLDSGAKINFPVKTQSLRWTNAGNSLITGTPLVALADTASVTLDLPIAGNERYIRVQQILVNAIFVDGAASYNVSERVSISPVASVGNQDNNLSFSFANQLNKEPMNMLLAVGESVAQAVQITVAITGGDVLRLTGITPGAADFVTFRLAVSYF